MKKQLGTATIEYNVTGKVKKAGFTPTLQVSFEQSFIDQLKAIPGTSSTETLKYNSEMVLAGWFNAITSIELEDRESVQIVSEIVTCEKYKEGGIKQCTINYYVVTKE